MKNRETSLFFALLVMTLLFVRPAFADDAPSDTWQKMSGQDFIIYYRPQVPDDFVQTTMDTAEEEFQRISNNMGIVNNAYTSPETQVKIYIYRDRKDYIKSGAQAIWSHGAAFARLRTIKLYPDVAGFFDTVLPHELGHIVFRDYVGFDTMVPLWFEEGVAIYQEKAKRLGSNEVVKTAIENGQFIPLSQLSAVRLYKNSNDQVVDSFYSESASVVYYMITELGEQEFTMLCEELKSGTAFNDALHKVYLRFKDVNELNQTWEDYLQGN